MSIIRYDPETGEKIFPDIPTINYKKTFRIRWNDGLISFIEGSTIADAALNAGYTKETMDNIAFWNEIPTP